MRLVGLWKNGIKYIKISAMAKEVRNLFLLVICFTMTSCGGCGASNSKTKGGGSAVAEDASYKSIKLSDKRLALFSDMFTFSRVKYGFSKLPVSPKRVMVDVYGNNTNYDVLLRIDDDLTSRTLAFKKVKSIYKWVGESETVQGPKKYTTGDGTFNERVTLTYETVNVSGAPLNKLYLTYKGPDKALAYKSDDETIVLKDVNSMLSKWRKP